MHSSEFYGVELDPRYRADIDKLEQFANNPLLFIIKRKAGTWGLIALKGVTLSSISTGSALSGLYLGNKIEDQHTGQEHNDNQD